MSWGGENQNIYQKSPKKFWSFFFLATFLRPKFSNQHFSDQFFFVKHFFYNKKSWLNFLTEFFFFSKLFSIFFFCFFIFFFDQNYRGPIIFGLNFFPPKCCTDFFWPKLFWETILFKNCLELTILLEKFSPFLYWLELFWTKKLFLEKSFCSNSLH